MKFQNLIIYPDSLIIIQISYQITNNYDSIFVDNRPGTQNNLLILITCVTRKFPKKTLPVPEWDFFFRKKKLKTHNTSTRLLIFNYKLLNTGKFLTFYHSNSAPAPPEPCICAAGSPSCSPKRVNGGIVLYPIWPSASHPTPTFMGFCYA